MRGGIYTLTDMRTPYVTIVCRPCNRRGRYAVVRLLERYGDAVMPVLLDQLVTDCPLVGGQWHRCRVVYEHGVDGVPHPVR